MMKRIFLLVGLCMAGFSLNGLHAQVLFNGGTYTQDFDSLGTSALAWENNVTLLGWYAGDSKPTNATSLSLQTAAADVGYMNLGGAGDSDRSLGGRVKYFHIYYGLELVNNTGATITDFDLGYTGEQWSDHRTGAQPVHVTYSLDATGFRPGDGTYVTMNGLTYLQTEVTGAGVLVDGRVHNEALTDSVSGINWAPGSSLWIVWNDTNNSAEDHALGINDFFFSAASAVPEPSTYLLLGVGTAALFFLRRRRKINN